MDPVLHGILLAAALVMVAIMGVIYTGEEGWRKWFGGVSIFYVIVVVILLVAVIVGGG